jgi:hypothetical protein
LLTAEIKASIYCDLLHRAFERLWLQRPLTSSLIAYAATDVLHLIAIARHLNAFDAKVVLALSQIQVHVWLKLKV